MLEESRIVTPISSDSDDDDSAFYDALETMQEKMMYQSVRQPLERFAQEESKGMVLVHEDDEPLERDVLPWLKDPNAKISIWAILKDNIGKDISRISVPVVFNDPTSLL